MDITIAVVYIVSLLDVSAAPPASSIILSWYHDQSTDLVTEIYMNNGIGFYLSLAARLENK